MTDEQVVIAGGGYAGVMCALRLAGKLRRKRPNILLINPRRDFVERLRLHEGLSAQETKRLRSLDIPSFLAEIGVSFLQGSVTAIDRAGRRLDVETVAGDIRNIAYHRLVLASGSQQNIGAISGADEFAYRLEVDGPRGRDALREKLLGFIRPRILVVGGGATGIEVAAELALKPDATVTLVTQGSFANFTRPAIAAYMRQTLAASGVSVRERMLVTCVGANAAETSDGPIPFDLCVVAAGFVAPGVLAASGLTVSGGGRVSVDPFLNALGDLSVYAVGDAAIPSKPCGAPPRMSVFFALATGAHVANTIADEISGRIPRPFGFWTYGQAYGLGKRAIGFANFPFDRPLRPYYTGRVGFLLRQVFVAILFWLLVLERRLPGLPFYLGWRRRMKRGPEVVALGSVRS